MLFRWLRNRRRQKLMAQPFPAAWLDVVGANVRAYEFLPAERQAFVRRYTQVFVAEKHWEGCRGLVLTDEIRVTIGAQVAMMMLGLPDQFFDHVLSVLVYPTAYVAREQKQAGYGIVTEEDVTRLGEAWHRGPVILSWADALAGGRGEGRGNVVFHEFAHQYDLLGGGEVDGTPPLDNAEQYRRWLEVTNLEYRQLVHRCHRGLPTLLDCYAATNRKEFFAVATETFFTRPHAMRRLCPELYTLLREVYRQDPAEYRPDETTPVEDARDVENDEAG